jgi:hypothetical protein
MTCVPQQRGSASWFAINAGAIGPPIAHAAAAVGMLVALGLAYGLGAMGYLSRTWGVVLIWPVMPFLLRSRADGWPSGCIIRGTSRRAAAASARSTVFESRRSRLR